MKINDQEIAKFQKIHFNFFGEKLSKEVAQRVASDLVELVEIISKPIPKSYEKTK